MNLSARAVLLAVLILLAGAGGLWAGGTWAGGWRYLAIAWLFALLVEGRWARKLPLRSGWRLAATPRLGQATRLEISIAQPGRRPTLLDVFTPMPATVEAFPAVHRLRLLPDVAHVVTEAFTPVALGPLQFPSAVTRLLGLFGMAWWTRPLSAESFAVTVVPDTLHRDERVAAGVPLGEAALLRRGPGLELIGLRDYQPGDPLRSIAWKASARASRLVVRDTVQDQHLEVTLVIDAGRTSLVRMGSLTRLHHYVNLAARFAERCTGLGDRLSLVTLGARNELRLTSLSGTAGLRRLRAVLGELRPENAESNPAAGAAAARSALRQRGLVVWLGDVDTADDRALTLAAELLSTQHLVLFAQLQDDAVLAERDRPAQRWLDPFVALASEQLVQQQVLAAHRLRRLGCEVVSAPPSRLEAAVLGQYLRLRARRRI